ncbi:flavin reductase [Hydrogenophaga taeniospiralis]|jgi:flavin reductase (DIM6/NTAB) family NADH-FMN oxidoreductase RutF/DNA-binding MarR family transcriptional regulator|nr:flavin reductase [Hydrogenophaga taeniospiralis]
MSPARSAGHQARPPDFSPRDFRTALGMFATGVTIVTARTASGELAGLTASSFNSVSLDPPLVLWSLGRAAGSMAVFANGQHYAINVLAADQQALAERFAARDVDRWQGVDFVEGVSGAPLLTGCVATFECFNRSQYTEGDHVIFVGEVERCTRRASASPLLYHGGRFYTEHPLQADPSAPQPTDGRFVGSYLGYLLGQASHAVYRDFENAIAAQGLTHIAWRVLAVLHDAALAPGAAGLQGSLPLGQLAHDVLAKQPTVTKLVQRMAEDGLVELLADPADQRRTLVATTANGRRIAAALIEQARQQETTLLSRWSPGEAEALKRHLQRLAEGR